jgi:hypothetical protein
VSWREGKFAQASPWRRSGVWRAKEVKLLIFGSHEQRRGAALVFFGREGSRAFDFWSKTRAILEREKERERVLSTQQVGKGMLAS